MKQLKLTLAILLGILAASIYLDSPNAPNTHIVVRYPKANLQSSLLSIRGSGCGLTWNKGAILQQTGTDQWSVDLTCTKSVPVELKVLEDTNWMMGHNYMFTPTSDTPTTYEIFPSFHPRINPVMDTAAVSSKLLNNSRLCSIYYPPSYYDNPYKQYPLLIMHDGQNLFEDSKSAFGAWHIQDTLNQLIPQGNIQELIVVGVWNTANRNNEYTYSYDKTEKFGGKGDLYLDFIEQELMPKVKTWLAGRLIPGRRLGIGGSSLGGLISCYAAYTRPEVYDRAICMSSSFWWNNQDFLNTVLKNKTDEALYLDSGDAGTSQDGKNQTLNVRAKLERMGYVFDGDLFYYLDQGGQHSEYYWGRRFNMPMVYLYG